VARLLLVAIGSHKARGKRCQQIAREGVALSVRGDFDGTRVLSHADGPSDLEFLMSSAANTQGEA
jgi:hypothetical protein